MVEKLFAMWPSASYAFGAPLIHKNDEVLIMVKCFVIPLPAVALPTLQFCYC